MACQNFEMKQLELFINNTPSIDEIDQDLSSTLHYLLSNKNISLEIVKIILEKQKNIFCVDKNGRNAIHIYCSNKNAELDILNVLIEKKIDPSIRDNEKKIPIFYLCENNFLKNEISKKLILLLIEKSNLSSCDLKYKNCLHYYLSRKYIDIDIVKTFLDKKISINQTDNNSRSFLHYAIVNPHVSSQVISLLIQNKSDPNQKDSSGKNCLHIISENKSPSFFIFKILVKLTLNVFSTTSSSDGSNTPLHSACIQRNLDAVFYLLYYNCYNTIPNRFGLTPFQICDKNFSQDFSQIFRYFQENKTILWTKQTHFFFPKKIKEQSDF